MDHWPAKLLPLVEKYGSARVFEIGLTVIGWPPTIGQLISQKEIEEIQKQLEKEC